MEEALNEEGFGLQTVEPNLGLLQLARLEVVLSVLVEAFKFSLTEEEIFWNWATVDYPTMGREKTDPSLVLNVVPLCR